MRFTSRNEPPPRRDAQSEKDKTRRPQRGTRKPQTNQNHPPRGQGPSGGGREGGEDRCPPEAAAKKPTTPAGHRQAEPVRQGRRPRPTERATEDDVRTHGGAPDQQKDPTHPTGNPAPAKAAGAQGAAPKARGKQARTPRGRRSGGPNTACRDGPTAATIHGLRRPGGQRHIHGESGAEGEPREGTRRTATHQPKGRGGRGDGSRRRALPIDGCTKDRAEPSANGGPRGWARNLQQEYLLIFFTFSNWLGVTRGSHSQRLATGGRKRGRHSWPPAGRSS